eukprot:733138-Rhodomonas_salina.1
MLSTAQRLESTCQNQTLRSKYTAGRMVDVIIGHGVCVDGERAANVCGGMDDVCHGVYSQHVAW